MRSTAEIQAALAALAPYLRRAFGVEAISIFGSYARGEQTPESDLDLLVVFEKTPGLVAFSTLADVLESRLGVRVDLATPAMIGPRLAPGVARDLVAV